MSLTAVSRLALFVIVLAALFDQNDSNLIYFKM